MSNSSHSVGVARMRPNVPKKLNYGRTILLSFAFTIVLLAWSFFNIRVPLLLYQFFEEGDIAIGFIMAIDNILAVLVHPFFGALSDRTKSRFGRRVPYIFAGALISAVLFVFFPYMKVVWGLIVIIFLFDLAMSLYRTASIIIVPDYTSEELRAKASGIQQFIANLGGAIGFAIPMVVSFLGFSEEQLDKIGFPIVAGLMLVFLILFIFIIKETPTSKGILSFSKSELAINPETFHLTQDKKEEKRMPVLKTIGNIFNQKDKSMVFTLLFVFFTYLAFGSVETFFSSFAEFFLGLEPAEYSIYLIAYSLSMILTAYFHGVIGQKIGRKRAIKIDMGILLFLLIIMIVFSIPQARDGTFVYLLINFVLVGIFWMGVIVNTFPVVWALAPEGQVGSYTGIYYTFNQLAYTLSPIIVGGILQLFGRYVWPTQTELRFIILFPYLFLCLMVAFIILFFIKGGEANISKEKVEEYTGKYVQND
ncbi:MAG: MFS transporter [Candidatus Lokiarchaeota archaeon]|nr:MFS transporter [Candidatus Lokiarchaeota archaeon]